MSGPETNVPNRFTDSNREAGALRPVTHATHTVASQEQLEGSRGNGKGYLLIKITPPSFEWWLEESNVLQSQPLHPLRHALYIFTDTSKEGWGAHLNEYSQTCV